MFQEPPLSSELLFMMQHPLFVIKYLIQTSFYSFEHLGVCHHKKQTEKRFSNPDLQRSGLDRHNLSVSPSVDIKFSSHQIKAARYWGKMILQYCFPCNIYCDIFIHVFCLGVKVGEKLHALKWAFINLFTLRVFVTRNCQYFDANRCI